MVFPTERAAPDNGVILAGQGKIDRYNFNTRLGKYRWYSTFITAWRDLQTKHLRYTGASDISIQDTHLIPFTLAIPKYNDKPEPWTSGLRLRR